MEESDTCRKDEGEGDEEVKGKEGIIDDWRKPREKS